MRVAIVGAGVAGLVTAKVLSRVGHSVVVFDRTPDVGGVWSETRRYPGVTTQSPRDTYAFSDFPMPPSLPEWPTGAQVQEYLAGYVSHFGLAPLLRLNTPVTRAEPTADGWSVDGSEFDHLVVANGVFSAPALPVYEGFADFSAAGGRLCAASDFHDARSVAGQHVLVVGYGKSSCDVAVEVSRFAVSTDVVARQVLWKVPRRIGGVVNFKYLLLTRLGEALFEWQHLRGVERFLHGRGAPIRRRMLGSVENVTVKQYRLRELDLVPDGGIENIVRGAIGLVTDGFYEQVADGRITVRRDRVIKRLLEKDGAPHAELSDGTVLRADTVVCATGYRQEIPFLPSSVRSLLVDGRGNYRLYRQIHPVDVPRLSFAGYNSSFFSPLSAEMGALWIAALLAGEVALPPAEEMRAQVDGRIEFMDSATSGHHCHGTKVIPFSMHNIDEILGDVGLDVPRRVRFQQWLGPVDPRSYRRVTARFEERFRQ
ncbi:flavin-containing monooxygenase [Cryptosporangium phraense]|uniref:Monooxygenase n=1 Tax=Cryptosporangium phraense TaxID=2593070 RepID=A0A545AQU4_9ACTN|nr:NAD(P)/FAD-dependent oxidoreductase [Cryptosporangium phraense]TQS43687.1 monooxygenase [Cryptosporangium phraense]